MIYYIWKRKGERDMEVLEEILIHKKYE